MLDGKNFRACYDTLAQRIDMCCNRFYSKKFVKHRMVPCNKDISIFLEGFEIPYIVDYLSRRILLKADTKFLFRESGRTSRQKSIKEHFASKGTFEPADLGDIHEFCALYKRWIRTLNEPLIPYATQTTLIRRLQFVGPELHSCHLLGMAQLLVADGLTPPLVCLLHSIFFLQQIAHLHKENSMSAAALAGIFAVIFFNVDVGSKELSDIPRVGSTLQGLIQFLEYLFVGEANSVFQEALVNSDLNKRKNSTNSSMNLPVVRSHSVSSAARNRQMYMADEPVLLEWRYADFDEAVNDEAQLLS